MKCYPLSQLSLLNGPEKMQYLNIFKHPGPKQKVQILELAYLIYYER